MPLRKKILIIIGVTVVGLIVILYATSRIILLGSFAKLEERHTRQNVERALSALADEVSSLDTMVFDWAAWDDTYVFIKDANEDYIRSNLVDETFTSPRLNLMLFINSSGQTVFGKGFDLYNEEEIPVPQSLREHLTGDALLLRHPDTESSVTGIVLLPEGPMLVASRPILTSEKEGPIRGTLIMGRYLDSAEIERLAEMTLLSLTLRRFDDPQMPPDFQAALPFLSEEAPSFVQPLSAESVAGYALLEDIYGEPSLVLKVDMSRGIYEQGQASVLYFISSLLAVSLVFGVVTLLLLEKVVLSRLARLSASISSIGASGDLSMRVLMPGKDELSSLAGAINGMLAVLEQSQTERKRAEDALRASQEYTKNIIESSLDVIVAVDMERRIVEFNKAAREAFGYSLEEVLGTHVDILYVNPRDGLVIHRTALERGRCTREVLNKRKNGELFPSLLAASVLRDAHGEPVGVMGISRDITERKQAEEALRESQARYMDLYENANDIIFTVDLEGRFTSANRAAYTALGYTREDVPETNLFDVLTPESSRFAFETFQKAIVQGSDLSELQPWEVEIVRRDGSKRSFEVRTRLIREGDEIAGFQGIARDITERKRAEEALREERDFAESLIETAQVIVLVLDTKGRIVRFNPYMEEISGYRLEEVQGQDWFTTFLPESDWTAIRELFQKAVSDTQTRGNVNPIVTKDGREREIEWYDKTLKDADGNVVGLLATGQDITERKRAEEALQESEEKYRTLVTQVPIGVITCDRAGNITHANPALLQILGSPGEKATRQFNVLTMPNLVEAGIAADFRRCMEDTTQIAAEYPYRSYWGKESVMRVRLTPLRDEDGAVSGALATVEDVSEQRRLQEQLIQSAKLASIGQLAAGVGHEINNPLNGIINYAQLLLNEAEPGSRQTRLLEGILREGDRVTNIVRDLLTFARVEKEAHSPAHVPDILRATLTLTDQQLRKDSVILEIEEQPHLPQIKCRSQRIQQVFLNLISNARDALNARYPKGNPNKRLTIRIEQVEKEGQPYVRTTFHDWGVGIPAQNLPRVFTPFFTTKKPSEGTGLGLSVSYGIVQDHRGDIQVESIEGEYTIFRVDLPVDNGWEL